MAKVSFIGLGVMGYPMAGYLAKNGHDVTVYNRTGAKAEAWVKEYGGAKADTPAEAAADCDFVMACVGNDDDLRSVTTGEGGAFGAMKAGAVFVDHTTASAKVARELYAVASDAGFGFVDAPVSGGQAGAENGALTVMCGGDETAYASAEPLIAHYAKSCRRLGDSGAGQLCKMVNQICIAGLVQGLAEALEFANKSEDNKGFAVDWMRKDLGICLEQANEVGARLPVTALVDQFYADVQAMGGNRWDTSSLVMRLNK